MQNITDESTLQISKVYETFLFSCTTPAFIWSVDGPFLLRANEQAEKMFEIFSPPGQTPRLDLLIRNWKDVPPAEYHTMWFEFVSRNGEPTLIQVRNSYLNPEKTILASVVVNPTWHGKNNTQLPLEAVSRILGAASVVFCSRTDFLEGFENLMDLIEIESGVSEIGFYPGGCFSRFDLQDMLIQILRRKRFYHFIESADPGFSEIESGKLISMNEVFPEMPDTWMMYRVQDGCQDVGTFIVVQRSETRAFQREYLLTILEILNFHFRGLLEKMEMTKSLYQNVFENSLNSLIVDNISEGVIIINSNFQIVYINKISSMMFGFSAEEVVGHNLDDLLVTNEGIRGIVSKTSGPEDEKEGASIRYLHRRSGETFPCHIRVQKLDFDEKNAYTVMILKDVTETEENRMKAEQLAQRAFLGDFASLLAHEIRNPINNMGVWIQNIKGLCNEGDEIFDAAKRIEDDCSRVSHLITNILAYSKPLKLNLEAMDMSSYLNEILERWKINFARANVKYYYSPPADFPKIMGDPRTLEQVFNNIIGNALDAFDNKGGVISLKLSLQQSEVGRNKALISISDSGPGIPDELIDHVFEPFVTSKKKGNGWGLAISKRIITSHKGTIQVKSYPGGTVFEIFLPVVNGGG